MVVIAVEVAENGGSAEKRISKLIHQMVWCRIGGRIASKTQRGKDKRR